MSQMKTRAIDQMNDGWIRTLEQLEDYLSTRRGKELYVRFVEKIVKPSGRPLPMTPEDLFKDDVLWHVFSYLVHEWEEWFLYDEADSIKEAVQSLLS